LYTELRTTELKIATEAIKNYEKTKTKSDPPTSKSLEAAKALKTDETEEATAQLDVAKKAWDEEQRQEQTAKDAYIELEALAKKEEDRYMAATG
jgi:hypothetical protein